MKRLKFAFKHLFFAVLLLSLLVPSYISCTHSKIALKVILAGSLMVPFAQIEKDFELAHPDVDVVLDGHGSIQVIRQITELGVKGDIAAVADYSLLPLLMYPIKDPVTNKPYADWSIQFATNSMGISYTDQSKYAGEINSSNWFEILARSDVKFAFSDPRMDSCGYRTLMLTKLAEQYYKNNTLFSRLIADNFLGQMSVSNDSGITTIKVNEIVESTSSRVLLRGYNVALLSLVETGGADYAFQYESMAKQHGLKFLELPDEINLGNRDLNNHYKTVKVKLDYQRFGTVKPEFTAEAITYGITIPSNAPHPEMAEEFIKFLLSAEGQKILSDTYTPPLSKPITDNEAGLPAYLKSLL